MKRSIHLIKFIVAATVFIAPSLSYATRVSDPAEPISHCYHWLNERTDGYLTYKYNYAAKNDGELSFFTTGGNGAVAGPGLYCSKTPLGSYNYGDRVIRIDFVDDVVLQDTSGKKFCGIHGNYYSSQKECDSKDVDVYFYSPGNDWYVIRNPQAVKSWSANSQKLLNDLEEIKADADSAGTNYMTFTEGLIRAELQTMPQKTYFNGHARQSLVQIIHRPDDLKKIPPLTLITMALSTTDPRITKADKFNLYVQQFDRALQDKVLTFSDINGVAGTNRQLHSILADRLNHVDYTHIDRYNTPTLLAITLSYNAKITPVDWGILWSNVWNQDGSINSLLSLDSAGTAQLKRILPSVLPAPLQVAATIKDKNIVPLLQLLDKTAVRSKARWSDYVSALFARLLQSRYSRDAGKLFDSLKNGALAKDSALAALMSSTIQSKSGFAGYDPLATGSILDSIHAQLAASRLKAIENQLMSLPLLITDRLSYTYVDDLQDGHLILPTFYSLDTFLLRLVQRSLAERKLGKATTNTYRLILSDYYRYFDHLIRKEKDHSKWKAIDDEAEKSFYRISQWLAQNDRWTYAYIAFQNTIDFQNEFKYKEHPLENALHNYDSGDHAYDVQLETFVGSSLDTSAFLYLSRLATAQRSNRRAMRLLASMLQFISGPQFAAFVQSPDFKYFMHERSKWANVIKSPQFGPKGRVFSDLCSFGKAFESEKVQLKHLYRGLYSSAAATLMTAERHYCTRGGKN